jgi:heme-degrading monooxygenase HmoA
MILVLSHAWALDEEHARAYVALTDEFGEFHAAQPGFRGRRLVRDQHDRSHFINLRWWDRREDYEAMIRDPRYPGWIDRLSEHVHARDPQKLVMDVMVEHPDPTSVPQ